jgi:hypothetical protein
MFYVYVWNILDGKEFEFTGNNDKEIIDKILLEFPYIRDFTTNTYNIDKVLKGLISNNANLRTFKGHDQRLNVVYIPKEIVDREFLKDN